MNQRYLLRVVASIGSTKPPTLRGVTIPGAPAAGTDLALETGVLRGIVAYRWLTLPWAALAVVFSRDHLSRPAVAVAALALALAVTIATTLWSRRRVGEVIRPLWIWLETATGVLLLLADGVVWGAIEDQTRRQSLPWAWPHAAILTAAAILGLRAGVIAAAILAAASFVGEAQVHPVADSWVGVGSKTALYFLAAVGTTLVMQRLREAATQISVARAREELARTLHDGVLQTLAVIQRRSDDVELVELARRQDQELRDHLWGQASDAPGFAETVARAAQRARQGYGIDVQVFLPDDLPRLAAKADEALAGAIAEAITNSAKHADASRVVVYAEPIDDDPDGHRVFCSVHDDGHGFDATCTHDGSGIAQSIRARVAEVGGRVDITSSPTGGTEVRVWVGGPT